ncbi:unnamed protein product [Orchesella dallaii]|uniref:Uncharacterized protein n=1 Tax=Orchesella dallaii TaxID=48710 RepID=A0ABP1RIR2_9HEXA
MGFKLCQLIDVAILLHSSASINVYSDNLKSVSTPQTSSDTGSIPGGQSIQAYLKELRTAQLPAINFFSPSKNIIFNSRLRLSPTSAAEEGNNCNGTQLSEKEKLAIWRREQQEQLFRNLTTGPITLFEGKYLYENGEHKEKIDSFSKLTKNHFFPKKYLVELNRKLYKGGILPPSGKEFQLWLDSIQTKSVTIIDAGIESLTKDIESKFNEWKFPLEVTYGNIPEHLNIPSFKTEQKYKVTHLTFELVTTPQSAVIVKAQQLNTSLLIIPSKTGAPLHLQMMDPLDSAQPSNLLKENRNITNFTIEELHANAKLAKNFWKDVGIPSGVHNVLLNEKYLYENFLEIIRENDENLLHQVINPAKEEEPPVEGVCFTVRDVELDDGDKEDPCAFYLDPAGQVEAIHPIVFVKIYEKADKTQKKKMATLAKHNIDKVEARVDNELERNIMIKLIQLEDIKSHAVSTEVALSIQNIDDPHGSADPAHFVKTLDDMEKQVLAEKCELKLSPYKIAFKLSNLATLKSSVTVRKELSPGVVTGSKITDKSIGYLFLGQTIINGIITGDTTALAIVGARTGFDIITGAAVKIGTNTKYFAEASKVGKSTKAIGDVAGPLGSAADIGLGVWSLTKAVNKFKNAENKYDRNDAIADIVQESVSIAVEATVTILSAVFPPFAPLFEAIGAIIDLLSQLAIAIFKAANQVAKINSKIPLSSSEKKYVFNSRFMDWFGTRQKDYLEFLLEEQAANNMAVQHNLKFLQDNPSFLGVVFPSRTLYYDGGCRLTKRHCALKNAWGCTRWENTVTLGTGCDRNRLCGTSWKEICADFRRNVGTWGYDEFKCPCSGSRTDFGEPRRHSTVDFRATKRLYWERAVPEDVSGAEFKCKPGSVTFQDYKVHQEAARTDFLCENAIAILQPRNKRNGTQTMMFNLEDGNDTVYLPTNDPTPNLFRVGNEGNKLFIGGSGKNEFLIDGDCSGNLRGTLTGGRSDVDAVTVLNSCTKGGILSFNGRTISTSDNKVFMQLTSIEAINGRDDEPDLATVDCLTRKVALGGGTDNSRRDVITVPSSTSCVYNVTALTGSYTTIQSEARRGTVSVLVDGRWKSAITNLDVHPDENLKLSMIFASTQSSQVTITTVNRRNGNITIVATASGKSTNPFQFELVTTSQNVTELVVALELTHKNWTSLPATKSSNGQSLTFRLEAKNNEHTVFTMRDSSEKIENQPYITTPYIQIFESNSTQIPGQLVLDREALSPKVFYQLSNITANKTGPNIIQGFQGISNMFLILLSSAMMDVALQPQLQLNGNAAFMEETGQSMNSTAMSKYVQPKWKIQPRPIRIPIGSVYSLSGEDFEDEQRIQLEEVDNGNSTNTNATFQMARNGTNLYFTNIISNNENVGEETQMELTTLIISDYFEEEREVYSNETLPVVGILPSKVTEVTVSLPGLQLLLNNSQIIFEQENSQMSTSNRRNTVANILTELRDWTLLLQEAESSIRASI